MAINKVVYDGNTLIDLTDTSVSPDTLAEGETALDRAGNRIVGRMSASSGSPDWNENDSTSPNYIQNRTHYIAGSEPEEKIRDLTDWSFHLEDGYYQSSELEWYYNFKEYPKAKIRLVVTDPLTGESHEVEGNVQYADLSLIGWEKTDVWFVGSSYEFVKGFFHDDEDESILQTLSVLGLEPTYGPMFVYDLEAPYEEDGEEILYRENGMFIREDSAQLEGSSCNFEYYKSQELIVPIPEKFLPPSVPTKQWIEEYLNEQSRDEVSY